MTDNKLPFISSELLDYLARTFPDRVPEVDVSEAEIRALAGVQRVVKKLRSLAARQAEAEMEHKVVIGDRLVVGGRPR